MNVSISGMYYGVNMSVKVAEEIWVCEKQTVTKWDGDILAYKEKLTKETHKQRHRNIEQ